VGSLRRAADAARRRIAELELENKAHKALAKVRGMFSCSVRYTRLLCGVGPQWAVYLTPDTSSYGIEYGCGLYWWAPALAGHPLMQDVTVFFLHCFLLYTHTATP
jgi:hypothetical protein